VYTRLRRELEPRWVSWYVAKTYPRAQVRLRCPLGPVPEALKDLHGPGKAAQVYRPWRPEVDALVIDETKIILVEAKIQKYMDGLSKLPVYRDLIPTTPELTEFRHLSVNMILLIPAKVDWVEEAAKKSGVRIVVEAPDFIGEAWEDRDKYWTPEAVRERERRKKLIRRMEESE